MQSPGAMNASAISCDCKLCLYRALKGEKPSSESEIAEQRRAEIAEQRRAASHYAWPSTNTELFAQGYQDDWFSYMVWEAESRGDKTAVAEREKIVAHYKTATQVCVNNIKQQYQQ